MHAYEATIAEQAALLLERSDYRIRSVTCDYVDCGGILTLRGQVSSYYVKQVAQTLVTRIEQVDRIVNLIEVIDGDDPAAKASDDVGRNGIEEKS